MDKGIRVAIIDNGINEHLLKRGMDNYRDCNVVCGVSG